MKKLAVTLLAAVLASGAFAQSSFPDIPANHWAGDAVDRIADLGIVIGFPDGTFRGNEAFTRYQAALVVSRLLDVIAEDINAAQALTQADIESLRNAVQELASDVASQGVRLSSAESAIAGLSDEVAANSARLDELEARLAEAAGVGPEVLRDLQNQIASQRVAIDTAQAQADAAAARADEAYSLANQANARAAQNAEELAALNRTVQLLSERLDELDQALRNAPGAAPADTAALADAIERNRSDIANLREFVILLNRNQVALRDRVAALEASDAEQSAAIASLEERVTALEQNPLGISGSISLEYFVGRVDGSPFDVDRAYGLNASRDMGASVFSSGTEDLDDDDNVNEVGERAQDRADIEQESGNVDVELSLAFNRGTQFDGAGSPNALNNFSAVLKLRLQQIPDFDGDDDADEPHFVFEVDEFTTTFSPIGGAPLTFQFGTDVETSFTPYVVATEDPGFVATLAGVGFLDFINPTVTAVYTTPELDSYLRGVRVTLSPFEGVTVGGSFAQQAFNAADKDDVLGDNVELTVWGVDVSLDDVLNVFDLGFEWANGTGGASDESILYATLDVDAASAGIPVLSSLGANYRSISDVWSDNGYNLGADDDDFPFSEDQTGFGVNAALSLFILDLNAYFDSFSTYDGAADSTAYGVNASANLFAGFSLSGWFHQASVNGDVVDNQRYAVNADELQVGPDMRRNGNNFDTGFGVELKHNGRADNALISGLNLTAGYKMTEADFSRSELYVNADYALNVSIVSLTPYVGFRMVNDADTVQSADGVADQALTEIKVGAGLTTQPLDVFLAPSLIGAVNYRNAAHTPFVGAEYTSTELQWSVGLVLNEFLFDHSTLTAKYGSWTGTNVQDDPGDDTASNISAGDENNGLTQSVSGYEIIWNYWDLEFAYGNYVSGDGSSAQAFSISYTVDLQ